MFSLYLTLKFIHVAAVIAWVGGISPSSTAGVSHTLRTTVATATCRSRGDNTSRSSSRSGALVSFMSSSQHSNLHIPIPRATDPCAPSIRYADRVSRASYRFTRPALPVPRP